MLSILLFCHLGPSRSYPHSRLYFPLNVTAPVGPLLTSIFFMVIDQSPDRVHPTGSETKYHVFNNKITDNVDIYHSEATTLKRKACTMKYTKNKGTYCNYSYTSSKPRDYIQTITILLIPTTQLQMG